MCWWQTVQECEKHSSVSPFQAATKDPTESSVISFANPQVLGIYITFGAFLFSVPFYFVFAAVGHCIYSVRFAGLQEEHGLQSQDPLGSYLGFAPSCCGLPGSQFPHLQNGA